MRQTAALVWMLAALMVTGSWQAAGADGTPAAEALRRWYGLALELVRHTPTHSPPVASRSFAYLGVTAFEAAAGGSVHLRSLAGQLNGFTAPPPRAAGLAYDEAVVMQTALAAVAGELFANTGPTGQRAMQKLEGKLRAARPASLPGDVAARSEAQGRAVAAHVLAWAATDGGEGIENMGFPQDYDLKTGPGNWTPTSLVALQQRPLLPGWGSNRSFAMPHGAACPLPPPPQYSEDKASEFYQQALEVARIRKSITPEQRAIARFWSDDPMLSPTPPGHWVSIALQVLERENADLDRRAETLARLGVALADAFIGCWQVKFQYDLLRPVTYIRRTMDAKWEPLLITPPFPEYPSGHSTQSAAAAEVLTGVFGEAYAFEDSTHARDGVHPRTFASFRAAAEEAGVSRLFGGIHFRAAVERGLTQGRCVGAFANALRMRN